MQHVLRSIRFYFPGLLTACIVASSGCVVGGDETDDVTNDDPVYTSALIGRGSCVVKINGVAVRTLSAWNRTDCYNKTSFGSAECEVYAPYLKFGIDNKIQQIFNGTDQVNSDTCVLPPTCVVKVRGIVVAKMSAPDRLSCYNWTSFGSDDCATYAPYFTTGNNLLEQYFAGNDRVNSETCVK